MGNDILVDRGRGVGSGSDFRDRGDPFGEAPHERLGESPHTGGGEKREPGNGDH